MRVKFLIGALLAAIIGWSSSAATASTCGASFEFKVTGDLSGSNSGCQVGSTNNDNPSPDQVNADAIGGINTWVEVVGHTDVNATAGSFSLSNTLFFSIYDTALLVLKGGAAAEPSEYVGYLLKAVDGLTGDWISPFLNDKGKLKDVSHYTIYGRLAVTAVPLPAGVALLGGGLALLGAMGWRKKRAGQLAA